MVSVEDLKRKLEEWAKEDPTEQLCIRIHDNGDTCRHDKAKAALYQIFNAVAEIEHERAKLEKCPLCGEDTSEHSFSDRKNGWCLKCDRQFCAGCWAEHDRKEHSR